MEVADAYLKKYNDAFVKAVGAEEAKGLIKAQVLQFSPILSEDAQFEDLCVENGLCDADGMTSNPDIISDLLKMRSEGKWDQLNKNTYYENAMLKCQQTIGSVNLIKGKVPKKVCVLLT